MTVIGQFHLLFDEIEKLPQFHHNLLVSNVIFELGLKKLKVIIWFEKTGFFDLKISKPFPFILPMKQHIEFSF